MTVVDFIEDKIDTKDLLYYVRDTILNIWPNIDEVIKYKTPFFTLNGFWIYLTVAKNNSINICFAKGYLFEKEYPQLIAHNRKYIRSLNYKTIEEIDILLLEDILLYSISFQKRKQK